MSRSGYIDDGCGSQEDQWAHIRWRGAVKSAIRGKRGQVFLRELLQVLDDMPVKELHADIFVDERSNGSCRVCAMGAIWKARGMPVDERMGQPADEDAYEDTEGYGLQLGIASAMAREIAYINDDGWFRTPRERYEGVRRWVIARLNGDLESPARLRQ